MGDRPVSSATTMGAPSAAAKQSTRWKLQPNVAALTQGLVASHFAHLPAAEALFLRLPAGANGAWLAALQSLLPISSANGSKADAQAATIAFTATGLAAMGLPAAVLASFSQPFCEGMHQADRQRRLGDVPTDDPSLGTVIPGGARWSANVPDAQLPASQQPPATPITVHVLLLVYAGNEATLAATLAPVEALLRAWHIDIGHRRSLSLRADGQGMPREHFGFVDGVSQPVPTGEATVPASGPQADAQRHWHGVPAGEILLGHNNLHDELAPGPIVASGSPGSEHLASTGAPDGFCNLGLHGSYLVVRELRQDVAAFWRSLDAAAPTLGQPGPGQAPRDARWLAERIVGRTLDGDLLVPGGTLPPQGDEPANNQGFAHTDTHGLGCPLGSHTRRANPRDALPSRDGASPDLSLTGDLLKSANAHRMLRRGRKYGPDMADPRQDDGQDRGLLFMALNSDLVRHFEFIQQTWLLNPSFATLFNETDPLLGPAGRMTIPACPLRLRPAVQAYVQLLGGEYFFLPSLPALDYLAQLAPPAPGA